MPESKKFLIQDYMRRPVVAVTKDATLKEAVAVMIKNKTNGLVVTNGNNKVAGIISGWDIIAYIVPDYLEEDRHLASFEPGELFEKRVRELAGHPVSKFMTKRVKTVKQTHTLMEAATMLSEHKIRQLPVVDDNGVLVGYINRTDIKRAIGEILGLDGPKA